MTIPFLQTSLTVMPRLKDMASPLRLELEERRQSLDTGQTVFGRIAEHAVPVLLRYRRFLVALGPDLSVSDALFVLPTEFSPYSMRTEPSDDTR